MASSRAAPADTLRARVAACLARHVAPGDTLTLGLSGGRDSVALFHLLLELRSRYGFGFACLHVHHGLSPNADDWVGFCAALCARHGVALGVERVSVDARDARGIEAAARDARRAAFARRAGWWVTAHHRDDQTETLLLQLLRGAGPRGLAAMAERQGRWLRPLLDVPRADVDAWLGERGHAWVDDESNASRRFRRNALRHDVLPVLATHFPGADAALARAAGLQAEAATLLDELAALDAARAVDGDRLDCAALAALSPARARNLLRHFVVARGGRPPQAAQLDEALRQLQGDRPDAAVRIAFGDGSLARWRGGAWRLPSLPAWAGGVALREGRLALGDSGVELVCRATAGAGLSRTALADAVCRPRRGGECIRLHPGGPRRALKTLLQERGVPPWRRDRLPLVFVGDTLAWAAGVGADPAFAADTAEPGWQLDWQDTVLGALDDGAGAAPEGADAG